MDPSQVHVLQHFWEAFGNDAVIETQADGHVGIFVKYLHERLVDFHGHIQFLSALPDEGLFVSLSGLHLAAYEFPKQPSGLVWRTAADEKLVLLPEEGGHHVHRLTAGQHQSGNGADPYRTGYSLYGRCSGGEVPDVHIPLSFRKL